MGGRRIVVVGAGIMGLWSALRLRETGHEVLLLDAWGAGHARATSGDENRVIRCGYGGSRLYAAWGRKSLGIWARRQREWGVTILRRCGVLWMVAGEEPYVERCREDLEALGIPHERLERRVFARRYPQIDPRGIKWALLEPRSGALLARRACQALLAAFERAGGRFRLARAEGLEAGGAGRGRAGRVDRLRCFPSGTLRADEFLFACGPWLPGLFPRFLSRRIKVSRKEVFYFGTPPGEDRYLGSRLPVWMELGTRCYGIPSLEGKGFKVHPDLEGRRVDPTSLDRRPSPRLLRAARECLKRRFPGLAGAPLIETRVCQYEATRDDHMIFDRHPGYTNVWIVGGGSGHCFKHGPAIGEMVAEVITEGRPEAIPDELRLSHVPGGRNF